ncbi:MAG: prepilin-type N-terminal cleavage/methylation domain-containing protein [Candidatus Pacebacteria bacterium]|nr:prepilin-type N-terminal cleavage/methylation domain-containing protein [Candidatus Paceibacterota bacterium]
MRTSNRGFTLIETLVAISILMIAVIIPLSIVAGALQSSYYARDQITAAYLAQDAIEYIRSLRDGNAISISNGTSPSPWFGQLDSFCTDADPTRGCDVDTISGGGTHSTGTQQPNASNKALKYEDSTGLYHASWWTGTGSSSRFTRDLKVTGAAPEYKVTVIVTWTGSGAGNKSIKVSESLFDVWQ